MTSIKLIVNGTNAQAELSGALTSGTVGTEIEFSFDSSWDGLSRTAVFRAGQVVKDVVLQADTVRIPPEVLECPGMVLEIGVYGTNADDTVVIPTVWTDAGRVRDGADPSGDPSVDPTLPVWAQILGKVRTLEDNAPTASSVGAIPAPAAAEVGQYFRVAAVDENGAVTAVEAVEAPTGGGEEVWETIVDYTVPEDCAQVKLTTDVNGNPFSLKKAVALFRFHPTTTVEGVGYVRLNFDASVDDVYGNNGSMREGINVPKNDGEYTFYRVMLEKNNEGITANIRSAVGAQTDNDIVQLKVSNGGYEQYNPTTLTPYAQGITAISVGSHGVAIGAGTRIKLLGVRE